MISQRLNARENLNQASNMIKQCIEKIAHQVFIAPIIFITIHSNAPLFCVFRSLKIPGIYLDLPITESESKTRMIRS